MATIISVHAEPDGVFIVMLNGGGVDYPFVLVPDDHYGDSDEVRAQVDAWISAGNPVL